jgi:tol-pal system protein YbgF
MSRAAAMTFLPNITAVRATVLAAAVAVLSGCATTRPEADPVVQKLSDLDSRLLQVERVLNNNTLLNLSQQIQAAQAEARVLRGQIDELQHQLQQSQTQQREMYGDVDRRLSALEGHPGAAAAAAPTAGGLPIPEGDDRANYQAAFDLLKDAKYPEAINAFQQYLTSFPNGPLADNAQYWLGEAHYVSKQYSDALRDFQTVIDKYPESRKIPDALLKIGYCNYELKNWGEARSALDQVVKRFGDTTAARLATQRLAKLDSENH